MQQTTKSYPNYTVDPQGLKVKEQNTVHMTNSYMGKSVKDLKAVLWCDGLAKRIHLILYW